MANSEQQIDTGGAQLAYIRFDTDFFDKPKVKAFLQKHGQENVNLFVRILCAIGRASDGRINRDCADALIYDARIDNAKGWEVITYLLENELLTGTPTKISNPRVQDDSQALARKRSATNARVRKHREVKKAQRADEKLEQVVEAVKSETAKVELTGDKHIDLARRKLVSEVEGDADWKTDNRYMLAGRRPMRDYPLVWLSEMELAEISKRLDASEIPPDCYKDLFLRAQGLLVTKAANGENTKNVAVYNWLTGFLFNDVLEQTIKTNRLAKVNGRA